MMIKISRQALKNILSAAPVVPVMVIERLSDAVPLATCTCCGRSSGS